MKTLEQRALVSGFAMVLVASLAAVLSLCLIAPQAHAATKTGMYKKVYYDTTDHTYDLWGTDLMYGYAVKVKSYTKKKARVVLYYYDAHLSSPFKTKTATVKLKKGKGTFKWSNGVAFPFDRKGKATIIFGKGWVKLKSYSTSGGNRFGVDTNGWIKIKKGTKNIYSHLYE